MRLQERMNRYSSKVQVAVSDARPRSTSLDVEAARRFIAAFLPQVQGRQGQQASKEPPAVPPTACEAAFLDELGAGGPTAD